MYISATLPYDINTLLSFIEGYNANIWPIQILFLLLAIINLGLFKTAHSSSRIIIFISLSAFWIFSGYVFFIKSFSELNFIAPYFGIFFLIESVLILLGIFLSKEKEFQIINFLEHRVPLVCICVSVFFIPLGVFLYTGSLASLTFVGATPLATSIYTIGILWLLNISRMTKLFLSVIPAFYMITFVILTSLLFL